MILKEKTMTALADVDGKTITADVVDISITGIGPNGVRFTYLDSEEDPQKYAVGTERPKVGSEVPSRVKGADIVLLKENIILFFKEIAKDETNKPDVEIDDDRQRMVK